MPFSRRSLFAWRLRSRTLALGPRTLIMGILNVTPDSFSDGGLFGNPTAATAHALRMLDEGADILDIGGESTRPGKHHPITPEEEQRRVLPVIAAILRARPAAILSIDTYHAVTARAAVHAGAEIVNDISGLAWDQDMASVCAQLQCGLVLMHTRGRPDGWRSLPPLANDEIIPIVKTGLAASLQTAVDAGIDRARIVLDPGYGFGKSFGENYPLLAHQDELKTLGQPILAGLSRKSFLGRTLADLHDGADAPTPERANATIAATTAVILAGAHIVRVHDVRPALEATRIADATLTAI